MKIRNNISLKKLNSFGIDTNAERILIIDDERDLENINPEILGDKLLILGGGTNILFTNVFDGTIVKCKIDGVKEIERNEKNVFMEVGAGVIWDDFVKYCVNKGYGGVENLSFIPGTVGAAPVQNIGAYGAELKDVFHQLEGINLKSGKIEILDAQSCQFGYRDSIFKRELKNKFIITKVLFMLDINPKIIASHLAVWDSLTESEKQSNSIKKVREVIIDIRKSKLPDPNEIGNAGSFFKNPIISKQHLIELQVKFGDILHYSMDDKIKVPAGWLIEKSGFKGRRFGNVGVHDKQALVLVNYGDGTGKEILNLAMEIQNKVFDKFNIKLETEVNIV